MLHSLYIKNYRNLKELTINSVSQINLITGKNNTGKSTILEAVAIYASRGDLSQIYQLLIDRGEMYAQINPPKDTDVLASSIRSLSSMFTGRETNFTDGGAIVIGDLPLDKSIELRFVKYQEDIEKTDEGERIQRRKIIANDLDHQDRIKIGFTVRTANESTFLSLDHSPSRFGFRGFPDQERFQLIRTANIDRVINGKLFDNIALSDKEQYIIEALKIIEPTTERIAFIGEDQRERIAVIKLANTHKVLPLRSMGDGINRVLTIILALVNADNGYLLIDEFENGLHYSVQEQLWKIIFKLAETLNIQVFATTHSNDCVAGFESVLNDVANTVEGKLIRLDDVNGTITHVDYSPAEIKVATNQNIEVR